MSLFQPNFCNRDRAGSLLSSHGQRGWDGQTPLGHGDRQGTIPSTAAHLDQHERGLCPKAHFGAVVPKPLTQGTHPEANVPTRLWPGEA